MSQKAMLKRNRGQSKGMAIKKGSLNTSNNTITVGNVTYKGGGKGTGNGNKGKKKRRKRK